LIVAAAGGGFGVGRLTSKRDTSTTSTASTTSLPSTATVVFPATPPTTTAALSETCGQLGYYQEGTETGHEPGYVITVTNNGTGTVEVTGWVVAFYSGTTEIGSDSEQTDVTAAYITSGQSFNWTPTPGNGPWSDANFTGQIDTTGTCQVLSVQSTGG
jgi:hypothetical protein